jgi:hypothetical protein
VVLRYGELCLTSWVRGVMLCASLKNKGWSSGWCCSINIDIYMYALEGVGKYPIDSVCLIHDT